MSKSPNEEKLGDQCSEQSNVKAKVSNGPKTLHVPPEILSKIHEYIKKEISRSDPDGLYVCNLALVCQSFYDYFATQTVFNEIIKKSSTHVLLQNSTNMNIWDLDSINEWYNVNMYSSSIILPSEIWNHSRLLGLVIEHLNVYCAPSREDLIPYANDRLFARLFIEKIPHADFFGYLGPNVRGDKALVLGAIKKYTRAIKHCTPALLNDREFIKQVVDVKGQCLEYLGDYRADSELVISASRSYPGVLALAKGAALADLERIFSYRFKKWQESVQKPGTGYCNACNRHR